MEAALIEIGYPLPKSWKRRATIVRVARRHFLKHGFSESSMTTIARELGGSKSTVWAYFCSKRALFKAVVDVESRHFRDQLSSALKVRGSLSETLVSFALAYLRFVSSPDALSLHRLAIAEAICLPEVGNIFDQRCHKAILPKLGAVLDEDMYRGEIPRSNPVNAAHFFLTITRQGVLQEALLGRMTSVMPSELERDAKIATELFFRTYGCGATDRAGEILVGASICQQRERQLS